MIKWSDGLLFSNNKSYQVSSDQKAKIFSNEGSPYYLSGIPKERLVNPSSLIEILECMLC